MLFAWYLHDLKIELPMYNGFADSMELCLSCGIECGSTFGVTECYNLLLVISDIHIKNLYNCVVSK